MADERKISELTQVTTLNDDDELVFVKYGDGNPGPEPSPSFASLTTEYANLTPEQKKDEASGTDYIIGTIVYNDLEGGFYGIELPSIDGGAKFLPLNIQDELVGHEGKEIKIKLAYSKLDDDGMVSIFMWGKLIFVDEYHIHEWSIDQTLCDVEVAGLTSTLARFNGTYDYYPHSTLTGRPFWVKNGIYNSDGTLDWDGTQNASIQAGSSSDIGFIYWIESTTGDSWWTIWSAHIGSAEFSPSQGSHCSPCTSTGSNNSMKLPYDDDGPGGFGSGVTLTSVNCHDTSIPTPVGPVGPVLGEYELNAFSFCVSGKNYSGTYEYAGVTDDGNPYWLMKDRPDTEEYRIWYDVSTFGQWTLRLNGLGNITTQISADDFLLPWAIDITLFGADAVITEGDCS